MGILEKIDIIDKRNSISTKDNVSKLSLFDNISEKDRKVYSMDYTIIKPLSKLDVINKSNLEVSLKKDNINNYNLPLVIPSEKIIFSNNLPLVIPSEKIGFLNSNFKEYISVYNKSLSKNNFLKKKNKKENLNNNYFITEEELKSNLKSIAYLSFSKDKSSINKKTKYHFSKDNVVSGINFDKNKIKVTEDIDELLSELNKKALNLDKKETFLEEFSFLESNPKVNKISLDNYKIKHLYSKIDQIYENMDNLNVLDQSSFSKKNFIKNDLKDKKTNIESKIGIFEEIKVPDIFVIKDDSNNLEEVISNEFSSYEKDISKKSTIPFFISKDNVLDLSDVVYNYINNSKKNAFNDPSKKININLIYNKALKDDNYLKNLLLNTKNTTQINKENETLKNIENKSKFSKKSLFKNNIFKKDKSLQVNLNDSNKNLNNKNLNNKNLNNKNRSQKSNYKLKPKSNIDYILPVNDSSKNFVVNNFEKSISQDLIYSLPIKNIDFSQNKIYEKYSLDDFTFVNIYFDNSIGLVYDLIQPELNNNQQKLFNQIKDMFYNNIDKDYFYFKGDSHKIKEYISKIYDVTLNKLSFKINSLERKLFLKFILSDFSGLGLLSSLLDDYKIIEISCSGENSYLYVYHIEYGLLKTNIIFEDIFKLNEFVLNLTKNMGLYISSTNPIIDGYLPNGYKVEGIYSTGDSSSRGSSFIIKKYLQKSITPCGLVNIGVGINVIFAYFWQAIENKYKIIITGEDDSFIIYNSIALFFPQKRIVSIQDYDKIILPHKEWVKRKVSKNDGITKKILINQTNSERPNYIILDVFQKDLFNSQWYNIDLFTCPKKILPEIIENLNSVNQKAIIIDIKRINFGYRELIEFNTVLEINSNQKKIFEFIVKDKEYHVNLLNSDFNIIDIKNKEKVINWLLESNIFDYKDFNNIVNEYYIDKDNILKKLGVDK
ncbi:MAG: hypothetical protein PHR26_02255 [Candidatus ainarchaeum sp.]|nr:hypothetical protein [Candidatus ainarchaeum sp.]MDD3975923.1 hypothetical protein [Candidatus ainarchaeum sp.]